MSQLAPNELVVNGDIHQLVPGYTEWSTVEYSGPHWRKETWRDRSVFLYYKNYAAEHLLRQKSAYVCEHDHRQKFATLQEAVETYKQYSLIQSFEKWNQEKAIVGDAWCQERGTPITTISLTLPLATIEALQERCTTGDLEQWIVDLLQKHLSAGSTSFKEGVHILPQKRVRAE